MAFWRIQFLYFFLLLASAAILNNCASLEYQVAQKNKEEPWGKCVIEVENKKIKPLEIYQLKKVEPNGSEKNWLEGHSSFSFNSSSDKWQATVISERDKKTSSNKCISSLDVRRNGIDYSQSTHILFDCERGLEIPSIFKSTLRTSESKWFALSLYCSK